MAEGESCDATIVFHDRDCGLCRRSIVFLAERDRELRLRFAPLQGETARQFLPAALREAGPQASVVCKGSPSPVSRGRVISGRLTGGASEARLSRARAGVAA